MVSSAVFGAAAGTGLALVVAMTIVVYRYYAVKRKGKYWNNLDRWPDPPSTKKPEGRLDECSEHCHDSSSSHVLNCWRKQQKNYYAVQSGVPGKLSEVLGDVLELACGGGGGGGGGSSSSGGGGGGSSEAGGKSGNSSSIGNAASRIGVVTGVATIRDKWAQRSHRSPLSSVATTDSADSTTSTSSEVSTFVGAFFFLGGTEDILSSGMVLVSLDDS
ncbi:hypothetical protein WH47_04844 [Habropoda laboriosa]|uniref:Uncharacterized protein n=1 Tax=Habropoda laboriosa TaxID=597456 RepID=A0A0L7QWK4_9HYME|nr:hypothetical protein WH47_04844 [Habropoda laboriosa]